MDGCAFLNEVQGCKAEAAEASSVFLAGLCTWFRYVYMYQHAHAGVRMLRVSGHSCAIREYECPHYEKMPSPLTARSCPAVVLRLREKNLSPTLERSLNPRPYTQKRLS